MSAMSRAVSNWKLPNEFGLSERTLDCLQLAVMEALKRKGCRDLIPVFLNPFDCIRIGLSVRRSEPMLQGGFSLVRFSAPDAGALQDVIRYVLEREGYCLLYYQTWDHALSAYRHKYDLTHWSFITSVSESQLTIVDAAGAPEHFAQGNTAAISWDVFISAFEQTRNYGVGYIQYEQPAATPWEEQLNRILRMSVHRMLDDGGLEQLREFAEKLENAPQADIVQQLERLEFELNYYRKLRDLWKVAVFRDIIPKKQLHAGWLQALMDSGECWSLVIGLLMKWKRQPSRDYHHKLAHYIWEVYDRERLMFAEMASACRGLP